MHRKAKSSDSKIFSQTALKPRKADRQECLEIVPAKSIQAKAGKICVKPPKRGLEKAKSLSHMEEKEI